MNAHTDTFYLSTFAIFRQSLKVIFVIEDDIGNEHISFPSIFRLFFDISVKL